jgi:ParB family transcriptional regulator, chromosome partitioning protein
MLSTKDKLNSKATRLAAKSERPEDHPVMQNNVHEGSFFYIDLSTISTDPNQPRKHFDQDSLSDLCESIRQTGLLQPVLIRKDTDDRIWLVAGERRYRAAMMAGLERIPAILTKGNPHEIALIENLQRENLKPIEEAEALERLAADHHYTHEDLSKAIGKARSTITEILSLNRLPEVIKSECRSANKYPRRLLVEIAKRRSEDDMALLFERVKKEPFKSDHIRSITRNTSNSLKKNPVEAILKKSQSLSTTLGKLDADIVDEEEKRQLRDELSKLEKLLVRILEDVGAPT